MPVCSRQLFHPRVPITLDPRREAFEYLIGIETGNDRHRWEFEHESRQKGHGNDNPPNTDEIIDQHEFGITAAADNSSTAVCP